MPGRHVEHEGKPLGHESHKGQEGTDGAGTPVTFAVANPVGKTVAEGAIGLLTFSLAFSSAP